MLKKLAAAIMLSGIGAQAADLDGNFALEGIAQATCEQFVAARQAANEPSTQSDYILYLGFVQGYMTAHNRFADDTFDLTPWQGLELLSRAALNFCEKNPEQNFFNAMAFVAASLQDTRLKTRSGAITATQGEQSIAIYSDILARAQRRLSVLGHYNGEPDGAYGPQTAAAFRAFQDTVENLDSNGLPDQATLLILFSR